MSEAPRDGSLIEVRHGPDQARPSCWGAGSPRPGLLFGGRSLPADTSSGDWLAAGDGEADGGGQRAAASGRCDRQSRARLAGCRPGENRDADREGEEAQAAPLMGVTTAEARRQIEVSRRLIPL
jgi:hypothetical protein